LAIFVDRLGPVAFYTFCNARSFFRIPTLCFIFLTESELVVNILRIDGRFLHSKDDSWLFGTLYTTPFLMKNLAIKLSFSHGLHSKSNQFLTFYGVRFYKEESLARGRDVIRFEHIAVTDVNTDHIHCGEIGSICRTKNYRSYSCIVLYVSFKLACLATTADSLYTPLG
jgi:hypothetical protein